MKKKGNKLYRYQSEESTSIYSYGWTELLFWNIVFTLFLNKLPQYQAPKLLMLISDRTLMKSNTNYDLQNLAFISYK